MRESDIKILCILPVYNGEGVVDKAIKSILEQSYNKWHLVIVNDGSTDNTKNILSQYSKDKRITLLTNKTNKGVYYSINKALYTFKNTDWNIFTVHGADDVSSFDRFIITTECFLDPNTLCGISAWSGKKYTPSKEPITYTVKKQTSSFVKLHIEYPTKLTYFKGLPLEGTDVFEHGLAFYSRKAFDLLGYFDEETHHSGDLEYLHRLHRVIIKKLVSTSMEIKALDPTRYAYTYKIGVHKTTQNLGKKYNQYEKDNYFTKVKTTHSTYKNLKDYYHNFIL